MNIDRKTILDIVKGAKPFFDDYETTSHISAKEGTANFVTETDIKVQTYFQEKLSALYPQIQFMGEEKDNSEIDFSGAFWILDPVDGTTNLIHHFTHSAISLALAENHQVKAGIVYNPYAEELFYAEKGNGAFLNGSPIHVSSVPSLSDSLISIGTAPYQREYADGNFEQFKQIFLKCQDIRRIGSAAIDLAYVACGRTDAFFERNLKPWDFAAGLLLIQEAGGKVTDFEGDALAAECVSPVLGTNGNIHEEMLTILKA